MELGQKRLLGCSGFPWLHLGARRPRVQSQGRTGLVSDVSRPRRVADAASRGALCERQQLGSARRDRRHESRPTAPIDGMCGLIHAWRTAATLRVGDALMSVQFRSSALALLLSQNPKNIAVLRVAAHWQVAAETLQSPPARLFARRRAARRSDLFLYPRRRTGERALSGPP